MKTPEKILRIRITAKDRKQLRGLMLKEPVDIAGAGGLRRDEAGSVSIEAYVAEDRLPRIRELAVDVNVIDDATATGRARQAEVGKRSPFRTAGDVPRGLGRKVGGKRP